MSQEPEKKKEVFACPTCAKSFKSAIGRDDHEKAAHTHHHQKEVVGGATQPNVAKEREKKVQEVSRQAVAAVAPVPKAVSTNRGSKADAAMSAKIIRPLNVNAVEWKPKDDVNSPMLVPSQVRLTKMAGNRGGNSTSSSGVLKSANEDTRASGGSGGGSGGGVGGSKNRLGDRNSNSSGKHGGSEVMLESSDAVDNLSPNPPKLKSSNASFTCIICANDDCKFAAIGSCNHEICSSCSFRLRNMKKENSCVICKHKLDLVIVYDYGREGTRLFSSFEVSEDSQIPGMDYDFNLRIAYLNCKNHYKQMQALKSPMCPIKSCREAFPTVASLSKHLKSDHNGLQFCSICVESRTQMFISEHQVYTDTQLKAHINTPGMTGHPYCAFCSINLFDAAALFKHMHASHTTCYLCPAKFQYQYYRSDEVLFDHIRTDHIICDICNREGTLASFRDHKDLRQHYIVDHNKLDFDLNKVLLGVRHAKTPLLVGAGGKKFGDDGSSRVDILNFGDSGELFGVTGLGATSLSVNHSSAMGGGRGGGGGGKNWTAGNNSSRTTTASSSSLSAGRASDIANPRLSSSYSTKTGGGGGSRNEGGNFPQLGESSDQNQSSISSSTSLKLDFLSSIKSNKEPTPKLAPKSTSVSAESFSIDDQVMAYLNIDTAFRKSFEIQKLSELCVNRDPAIKRLLCTSIYAPKFISWVKKEKEKVLKLEKNLKELLQNAGLYSYDNPASVADSRHGQQVLALHYGMKPFSYDREPSRFVSISKQPQFSYVPINLATQASQSSIIVLAPEKALTMNKPAFFITVRPEIEVIELFNHVTFNKGTLRTSVIPDLTIAEIFLFVENAANLSRVSGYGHYVSKQNRVVLVSEIFYDHEWNTGNNQVSCFHDIIANAEMKGPSSIIVEFTSKFIADEVYFGLTKENSLYSKYFSALYDVKAMFSPNLARFSEEDFPDTYDSSDQCLEPQSVIGNFTTLSSEIKAASSDDLLASGESRIKLSLSTTNSNCNSNNDGDVNDGNNEAFSGDRSKVATVFRTSTLSDSPRDLSSSISEPTTKGKIDIFTGEMKYLEESTEAIETLPNAVVATVPVVGKYKPPKPPLISSMPSSGSSSGGGGGSSASRTISADKNASFSSASAARKNAFSLLASDDVNEDLDETDEISIENSTDGASLTQNASTTIDAATFAEISDSNEVVYIACGNCTLINTVRVGVSTSPSQLCCEACGSALTL